MAHQAITSTPAKKDHNDFQNAGINSATRNTTASSDFAKINGVNSNASNLKSFLTPHKSTVYIEDSDSDDDGLPGGGVKLTPQPRGIKSDKTVRYHHYQEHSEHEGGASLSAPRPKTRASPTSPQTKRWGKSVAFAKEPETNSETEHDGSFSEDGDHSSNDGAETVATSNKTTATGTSDGTLGSSPNTMMSPAYSVITPKTNGWTGSDAAQFVQTVPAHFAPRSESRNVTDAPPPVFDLATNVSNLVGQVIARATQSTPGSVNSAGTGPSSGLISNQAFTQDVFQSKSAVASPVKYSSALVQRGNSSIDVFRSINMSSPGSVTSSILHRDSFGSVAGASPGQLQRRHGLYNDIGLQQILEHTQEAFPKLILPKLNSQPATFDASVPASEMLNFLTSGFVTRPPFDLAMSPAYEPFIQSGSTVKTATCPVIKIDDLPYEAKVSDIIAFVGGNAKILNDADEPVHIMMERITAKTGAAYVEFYDFDSAVKVVDKHRQAKAHGKPVRINTRIVTVTISSQDALLKDLFPYARQVDWIGGMPVIQVAPEKFRGFVTEEELISLVKNVEFPHRVPYTKACPQRSVETLISIIKKLPWQLAAYITIRQRYRIYKAAVDMIQVLQGAIYNNDRRPMMPDHMRTSELLNEKLLKRVIRVAMSCPGFTPLMKDNIAFISSLDERQAMDYGLPAYANAWRHIYALTPNPAVPGDVVDYYIALIREETTRMVDALPPMLRRQVRAKGSETDPFWGYFWAVVGLPEGDEFEKMSLQTCADLELNAIDIILGRALPAQGMLP